MFKKQTKSFTLIEVLIGIVVVGILSSFIIVSISSFVDDANDTKRKKDLDSIASSLLAYKTLTGSYPIEASDCNIGEESCLNELTESGYATNFPIDPDGTKYTYTSDGTTYTIKASLSSNQTLSYNPDTGYSEYQGLAGYTKRKSITVASSASLTNYQMKFIVYRSTGTDSGSNVFVSNNCQDDYDDIRFTNSSNQVLDYWIESSDSSSATIWVEADSLASGNTTLYLYYGNSSETTAVSNGNNTFELFDDFSGSSVDTSKWNISGSISVSGGIAYLYDGDVLTSKLASFGTNHAIRARAVLHSGSSSWGIGDIRFTGVGESDHAIIDHYGYTGTYRAHSFNDGTSTVLSFGYGGGSSTYHTWQINKNGTTSVIYIIDDTNTKQITSNVPNCETSIVAIRTRGSGYTGTVKCDWIFVRKYMSSEPSVSWGSEENI